MTLFQAIAYGLVQGLGEFLPISSSAHLALLHYFLGAGSEDLAFDVALHMGTLLALLVYFRTDIVRLARGFLASVAERRIGEDVDRRLAWFVVLASVPSAIAGVLLKKHAEETFRHAPMLIATFLIVMGVLLHLADRVGSQRRGVASMTLRDALIVGGAQVFALFPGVSRSGSTITAGRLIGLDRQAAARFSFLLAAPVTAGAGLIEVPKLVKHHGLTPLTLTAIAVSGITGYVSIEVLLRLVRTRSYLPFAVYRVVLGAVVLLALALGYPHGTPSPAAMVP